MFEVLSEKLVKVFHRLSGRGRLTEKDVDEALREVRLALLEADVNFRVVRDLVARIRDRAVGAQVLESLTPAQQVIKIVYEEMVAVLGSSPRPLIPARQPPSVAMLVGLQGSGKTTTVAKLALHLCRGGQRVLMAAADPYRPAAIEQLAVLGRQLDIPIYREDASSSAVQVATHALSKAREQSAAWLLVDTAGRLHIDEELMRELTEMEARLSPAEVLLVVDAMTGQDAVRVAQEFQARVGLTGLILTKVDGDARGGAALSITSVTGLPIKFMGTGEKADALEPYYPDRLASRILGMGDVQTLVEKAGAAMDLEQAKKMEKKLRQARFDLEDFLEQLRQVKKMGSLAEIMGMIPGLSGLKRSLPADVDEVHLKRVEAIILSMTPEERRNPEIITGSRRQRIARGSGTTPQQVNQLLNQYSQMQKLMKQMASGRGRGLPSLFR